MPDTGPTGSLLPAGLWQNWPPRFLFFSYAAIILTEYHLQHPMQAIFNLPVCRYNAPFHQRRRNERCDAEPPDCLSFSCPGVTRVFDHDHGLQPQPWMAFHAPLCRCADPVAPHFNAPIIRLSGFALLDALSGYLPLKRLIEKPFNLPAHAARMTLDCSSVQSHHRHPHQCLADRCCADAAPSCHWTSRMTMAPLSDSKASTRELP